MGCHFLLQRIFPTQRLASPVLAGRFFITSASWEVHEILRENQIILFSRSTKAGMGGEKRLPKKVKGSVYKNWLGKPPKCLWKTTNFILIFQVRRLKCRHTKDPYGPPCSKGLNLSQSSSVLVLQPHCLSFCSLILPQDLCTCNLHPLDMPPCFPSHPSIN